MRSPAPRGRKKNLPRFRLRSRTSMREFFVLKPKSYLDAGHLTNTIAASAAPARFPTSFDGLLTSIGGHSPGRHLGLLRVPSILRPLLRPTPRDAAVAGGAHGRGLPARRSCVRLHLRRRRAEPSACRRYALMRSISSRRSVWFTLNSSSGVAARRNAAPSHECADEASPAFPCVCRRGG